MDNRPIGVFDSGIGGLTVVDALAKSLPNETIYYVGDTARVPYGNKSKSRIQQYSAEITTWLNKKDCKIIIVACNTASALALKHLSSIFSIPIIGVIESGVNQGIWMNKNNRIAVLGTSATIRSNEYEKRIKAAKPGTLVVSQACPLFVPLAEEGWIEGKIPMQIAAHYLTKVKQEGVDTVILGCTHYPLLKRTISKALGAKVNLVDSGDAVVKNVILTLEKINGFSSGKNGKIKCYVTDTPSLFDDIASSFCFKKTEKAIQIDL
ncbi:glutamate racemase [Candidatus Marinimicrobia bacterium]|nr:glutamate racemase [Candidatus Neomarinimicrobiota bacterium]